MSDIIQVALLHGDSSRTDAGFLHEHFWDSKRTSAVESYAYVHRETAGSASSSNTVPDGAPPGNRRFAHYVDVRDIDSLPRTQAQARHSAQGGCPRSVNQPYGQRELLVLAPDGNLIVYGQSIHGPANTPESC
jgi:hypothetical protein